MSIRVQNIIRMTVLVLAIIAVSAGIFFLLHPNFSPASLSDPSGVTFMGNSGLHEAPHLTGR